MFAASAPRWRRRVVGAALGVILPPLAAAFLWPRPGSAPDEPVVPGVSVAAARAPETAADVTRRGRILDRNRRPLADNRQTSNFYIVPGRFRPALRQQLIALLGLDEEEIAQMDARVASAGRELPGQAVLVLADQSRQRVAAIAQAPGLARAVEVRHDWSRDYPHRSLAAHAIGYLDAGSAVGEAESGRARQPFAAHGLERALDRWLRAPPAAVDAQARAGEPAAGHDVILTLDLATQKLAEKAVARHAAAAVAVVEVDSGRILALVSTPAFDPNSMSGRLARSERDRLRGDPRDPLVDRTLQRSYAPASTYKLVTAVAGLESHRVPLDEQVTCHGQRTAGDLVMKDMLVHGSVAFTEAMQVSCNVYFWQLGERVGIDGMARVARDFGFGTPSGLGFNDDVAGQVTDTGADDGLVATLNTAIGDGEVSVTVVQLAMAYAALANGGRLYAPQIVRRVETADGQVVVDHEPVVVRQIDASATTLRLIRRGMLRAVNTRRGTAFVAHKGSVKMAGKSGTAPSRQQRPADAPRGWDPSQPNAWFVGWAPARRPRIVVAVLIEHGGAGGPVAAPVARTIVEGMFAKSRARGRKRARR